MAIVSVYIRPPYLCASKGPWPGLFILTSYLNRDYIFFLHMKPRWSPEPETVNSVLHTKVYKLAETFFFLTNYWNILKTKMHRSHIAYLHDEFAYFNFRFLTHWMTLIFIFEGVNVEECKSGLVYSSIQYRHLQSGHYKN